MPQMMPLAWLFIYFLIIFLLLASKGSFYFTKKGFNLSSVKIYPKNKLWKW